MRRVRQQPLIKSDKGYAGTKTFEKTLF